MANIWDPSSGQPAGHRIDGFATRLLALHQPVAKDLRFLTAAIKINSDLERMGDLAVTSPSVLFRCCPGHRSSPLVDVPHMSRTVESMVRKIWMRLCKETKRWLVLCYSPTTKWMT